ncbi:MAG: metalloregulator ArsR/SmtB family transcription factor [Gammaproteobacteria bacterium]|nr:metalloregulator ArsR/SmtB family transcription factor [Gammaproteobacteria bacterium]
MNIRPAELFAVLSHESRLRCVLLLFARGELCVCDLTQVIGEPQPNISRHLGQLRALGLVTDRRDGQWIHYRLNPLLPDWVERVIEASADAVRTQPPFVGDRRAVARLTGAATNRCR